MRQHPVSIGIGAAVVLAIGLVLAFGVPAFVPAVANLLPTATPAPTPTAFAAASAAESLIIVADFADKSAGAYAGIDPDQYIYRALTRQVAQDGLPIRVALLDTPLDANNVRRTGEFYNATLVVWGQYDTLGITPYVERIRPLRGGRTDEEGQNVLVDQERVQFSVVTDLPAMSSYLVLFTLGSDANANQQWDQAAVYLTSAINALPAGATTKPDEAYVERGLAHNALGDFQRAIADFSAALDAGFSDVSLARYHRGLAYRALQDFRAAIADFTAVLDAGAGDVALVRYHRGLAYSGVQEFRAAIADFTVALDAGFGDAALVRYHRGLAYSGVQEFRAAIADFTVALDAGFGDVALVRYHRGMAYSGVQEFRAAIADFTVALDAGFGDVALVRYHRGLAYSGAQEFRAAIADLQQTLALLPENDQQLRPQAEYWLQVAQAQLEEDR